jgi:hypothetical protein
MVKTYIQKDDQRLPDYFTIKVEFVTGKVKEIEVTSIIYLKENKMYEIWTKEDKMIILMQEAILAIEYDKEWTKIVEIKKELKEKENGFKKSN